MEIDIFLSGLGTLKRWVFEYLEWREKGMEKWFTHKGLWIISIKKTTGGVYFVLGLADKGWKCQSVLDDRADTTVMGMLKIQNAPPPGSQSAHPLELTL